MPVELRKRKAPAPPPEPPAKKPSKVAKAASKVKEAVKGKPGAGAKPKANGAEAAKASATGKKPEVGDTIDLASFGGDVTTNDGETTTLAQLVDKSGAGVVLFTYPKASTPGCTTQACMFRDSYEPLIAGGLAIYGLSRDSPKSNTTFKEKQKLPYPLLCDPSAGLIGAIGLKKAPSGTQRGVFAVDKKGKVLLAEPGGPAATVDAVKKLVESESANDGAAEEKTENEEEKDERTNGAAAEKAKAEGVEEKKED
ncbi:AhpC/TSA family protein [Diaporthe helianthi]|uniref:thioredoxin-dependent peroxiredoxin n=1 Tax=Diaporthe helianthi TaxID=158607 RepID=A0A2P5HVS8_DIAHE|nr:AhpC/TSA family protein [Diaporthe helianthi]